MDLIIAKPFILDHVSIYDFFFFCDVMTDPYSVALNTPQSAQLIDFSVSDKGSSSFFIYAG